MAITINDTVTLGPKTNEDRVYRVTDMGPVKYTGVQALRVVTVQRISDGTTWEATVNANATRINWNVRLERVITWEDRQRAMRETLAENAEETKRYTIRKDTGKIYAEPIAEGLTLGQARSALAGQGITGTHLLETLGKYSTTYFVGGLSVERTA
jgi:hypothetical protein